MTTVTRASKSIGIGWNFFIFSLASNVFVRGKKKLRVPFKQSKHPLQALYNSKPSQLSLLTNCPRSFFQSSNLSARADAFCCHNTLATRDWSEDFKGLPKELSSHHYRHSDYGAKTISVCFFQFAKQRKSDNFSKQARAANIKACT